MADACPRRRLAIAAEPRDSGSVCLVLDMPAAACPGLTSRHVCIYAYVGGTASTISCSSCQVGLSKEDKCCQTP